MNATNWSRKTTSIKPDRTSINTPHFGVLIKSTCFVESCTFTLILRDVRVELLNIKGGQIKINSVVLLKASSTFKMTSFVSAATVALASTKGYRYLASSIATGFDTHLAQAAQSLASG